MATIGLDQLYYAKITENAEGVETYGAPVRLAKAIKADLTIELAEAVLYADDAAAASVKEFKSGKLALDIDDIGTDKAQDLTGATVDDQGVLVSTSEDSGCDVAVGFRARKANNKYRYFWLYRVKFGIPATNLETKADGIKFSTPSIEGTVMRRNKTDARGYHPWKAEISEDGTGIGANVIAGWFNAVYEPDMLFALGQKQVETATVLGAVTASGAGNATVIVTAAGMTGSPKTVSAAVANSDTAAQVAGKIRAALTSDANVGAFFDISGSGASVVLTRKAAAANDATLNVSIANGTCAGLTAAPTSSNTALGVAPA